MRRDLKIGICTPCYDANVHNQHMLSAITTDRAARLLGYELVFYTGPGVAVLPRVRNRLAAQALADLCDYVVFIDADIAWKSSDLFKMIAHDEDVVAAGPPKRHNRWDEKPAAVAKFMSGGIRGMVTDVGRLWNVDGAATAMMVIRRGVFYRLEPVTREYVTEGVRIRDWFWFDLTSADDGFHDEGEDYNFCRKFRDIGGKIWIDPDVRLRHYTGNLCHDVCFADFEKEGG